MRAWRIVLMLIGVGSGGSATGQLLPEDQSLVTFGRYQSVRDRRLTGYATPGLPVGSFTVRPNADANIIYNDNVLALEDDPDDDAFVRVSPSVSAGSNWSNGLLSLNAAADIDRYASLGTENTINFNGSAYGTYDVGRRTRIRALGRYQTLRESRESQDVFVLTRRPVRYSTGVVGLGVTQRLASALVSLEGGLSRSNYDDARSRDTGAPVDEDFRDSTLKRLRGRVEFGQSPSLAYFAQATHDRRDYRLRGSDPLAGARGSRITELLAGARFELPILARGEIGVGYTRGNYRGVQFNTFSGLAIRSEVTFFPTQLTNVAVTAERRVTDTGLPGSGGYSSLVGGVRVDHELLRPLLLSAYVRGQRDRFNGVDRADRRIELGANAAYRLNDNWAARVSYDRIDLSSRGDDAYKSFKANRLLFGLGLRI